MFKPVYGTYITILLILQIMCLIVKMQNMFFGCLKLHIPDVFNCDTANIWNTRKWGGIYKTFEFILAQTCIYRCRVNQYLIVLNLFSVSISKVLVTIYYRESFTKSKFDVKYVNTATQWNQQRRSVFSKVIKCLEQNIGKQVDKKGYQVQNKWTEYKIFALNMQIEI